MVGALDAERDALQAELDRRAETAAGEAGARAAERQQAEETRRCAAGGRAASYQQACNVALSECCSLASSLPCRRALAATEARLAAAAARAQEAEGAAAAQHVEAQALGQHVAGVEAEFGALSEEYHAVTDDLAALVKENQARPGWLGGLCAALVAGAADGMP